VDALTREVAAKPFATRLLQGEPHAVDVEHVDRGQAGFEFTAAAAGQAG